MDNNILRKLQLTELEFLIAIDKIWRDNGICYLLCVGALIGDVRHKGFVTWDDDLDIRMDRFDYDRFIQVWNAEKPDRYILQNKENTSNVTQPFT